MPSLSTLVCKTNSSFKGMPWPLCLIQVIAGEERWLENTVRFSRCIKKPDENSERFNIALQSIASQNITKCTT